MASFDRETLKRFLLGQLDDSTREDIREHMLRSPQVFEQLREIEDDLLDEYVRGELTGEARAQLERFVVESGQASRLDAARALGQQTRQRNGGLRVPAWAAAAALAIVTAGIGWLWLRPEPVVHRAALPSWQVSEETTRGAGSSQRFRAVAGPVEIGVRAALVAGAQEWSAEIRDAARRLVHGQSGTVTVAAGTRATALKLVLPNGELPIGFYTIEVRAGGTLVAAYRLEIVK